MYKQKALKKCFKKAPDCDKIYLYDFKILS